MAAFIFFYAAVSQFSMPIAFAWIPDVLKDQKTLSMATGVLMIGANIGGALGITLPSMAIDAAGGSWAAALPVVVGRDGWGFALLTREGETTGHRAGIAVPPSVSITWESSARVLIVL